MSETKQAGSQGQINEGLVAQYKPDLKAAFETFSESEQLVLLALLSNDRVARESFFRTIAELSTETPPTFVPPAPKPRAKEAHRVTHIREMRSTAVSDPTSDTPKKQVARILFDHAPFSPTKAIAVVSATAGLVGVFGPTLSSQAGSAEIIDANPASVTKAPSHALQQPMPSAVIQNNTQQSEPAGTPQETTGGSTDIGVIAVPKGASAIAIGETEAKLGYGTAREDTAAILAQKGAMTKGGSNMLMAGAELKTVVPKSHEAELLSEVKTVQAGDQSGLVTVPTTPGEPVSKVVAGELTAQGKPLTPAAESAAKSELLATDPGNVAKGGTVVDGRSVQLQIPAKKVPVFEKATGVTATAPAISPTVATHEHPLVVASAKAAPAQHKAVTAPPTTEHSKTIVPVEAAPAAPVAGNNIANVGSYNGAPAATVQEVIRDFEADGLSKEWAAAMTANDLQESALEPTAVGDHGTALGLGQDHPDRQAGEPLNLDAQVAWQVNVDIPKHAPFLKQLLTDPNPTNAQIAAGEYDYERYGDPGNRLLWGQQIWSQMEDGTEPLPVTTSAPTAVKPAPALPPITIIRSKPAASVVQSPPAPVKIAAELASPAPPVQSAPQKIVTAALSNLGPSNYDPNDPTPQYRNAENIYDGESYAQPYSDCGVLVATTLHESGADPDYPRRGTGEQAAYLRSSPKYTTFWPTSVSQLQPGDILVANGIGADGQEVGHTYIYVGDQGNGLSSAMASWTQYTPKLNVTYFSQDGVPFMAARLKS